MIKKEEINHIVKLSRLSLTEEEINIMEKELFQILNYVNLINEIKDLDKIQIENKKIKNNILSLLREDEIKDFSEEEKEFIFKNFPEKENSFIKAKKIF
ncbi:MAG: Asp-tRNA(Asn)/Glu-tRNA(Gln) amidotransferase subunit GatC [Minisyncoccia bacterium]